MNSLTLFDLAESHFANQTYDHIVTEQTIQPDIT